MGRNSCRQEVEIEILQFENLNKIEVEGKFHFGRMFYAGTSSGPEFTMRLWFSFQFRASWSTFPHDHAHVSADGGPRGLLHARNPFRKVKNAESLKNSCRRTPTRLQLHLKK